MAAIRAGQLGLKTLCIEKSSCLGGTCLNVGCIPSKALLQATEYYSLMQKGAEKFGIVCDSVSIDFGRMMKRKEEVISGFNKGIEGLFKKNRVTRMLGKARITGPTEIVVEDSGEQKTVQAKNILLATGSVPVSLPFVPRRVPRA